MDVRSAFSSLIAARVTALVCLASSSAFVSATVETTAFPGETALAARALFSSTKRASLPPLAIWLTESSLAAPLRWRDTIPWAIPVAAIDDDTATPLACEEDNSTAAGIVFTRKSVAASGLFVTTACRECANVMVSAID